MIGIFSIPSKTCIISASGVISHGFSANFAYACNQGINSGSEIIYDHTIAEIPLTIMLASCLIMFLSIITSGFG